MQASRTQDMAHLSRPVLGPRSVASHQPLLSGCMLLLLVGSRRGSCKLDRQLCSLRSAADSSKVRAVQQPQLSQGRTAAPAKFNRAVGMWHLSPNTATRDTSDTHGRASTATVALRGTAAQHPCHVLRIYLVGALQD
jgi:hypothetical protein